MSSPAFDEVPRGAWTYDGPREAPFTYFRLMDELQVAHRPFFLADDTARYYVLTDQQAILEAFQNPELFSSAAVTPTDPDPAIILIPEQLDPPEHTKWRQLLTTFFAPRHLETMAEDQRAFCIDLIQDMRPRGGCEFVSEFARLFPTSIFLRLFGLPMEDFDRFMEWEHRVLHLTRADDPDHTIAGTAMMELVAYLGDFVSERRKTHSSTDGDVISAAVTWEVDGRPVTDDELMRCLILLFVAGLDTVANQLSYAFMHLASHPEDRRRIAEDPTVVPHAVEEILRTYPIVQPARKATRDLEFHGCPLRSGDMVILSLAAAGRDDLAYEHARHVDLGRPPTRHLSFGAGPHRCLGSHLARQELKIALEEWHRLVPEYELSSTQNVTEHGGAIFGLDSLPLMWEPTR